MSTNKATPSFYINGKNYDIFTNWQDARVLATFDSDQIQANLNIDKLCLVKDAAKVVTDWINGEYGIMECIPCKIELSNNVNSYTAFDGLINLSDGLEIDEETGKVYVKIIKRNEIYTLEERLRALNFGYLDTKLGLFSDSDYVKVQYIVKKEFNLIETIMLYMVAYMMEQQLEQSIKETAKDIGVVAGILAAGVTGSIGALIASIAVVAADIVYAAFILTALINLGLKVIDQLIPIRRTTRAINVKKAMEKVCSHLNLTLQTNLTDLNSIYTIPSNYNFDETNLIDGMISEYRGAKKGIPNSSDYGYQCLDYFDAIKKLVNGKFYIEGNTLHFYTIADPYFIKKSAWKIPSVLKKRRKYNTDKLKSSFLFTFATDSSDYHTIKNYKGTSFQVLTRQKKTMDKLNNQVKGYEEVRIGMCLGSRKDQLTGFENILKEIAQVIDKVVEFFGGTSDLAGKIEGSIGLMVVGDNNYMQPKVLMLDANKRLVNRDNFCAKYLVDKYYNSISHVKTVNGVPYYGQELVYENVRCGFGMSDFMQLINNNNSTEEVEGRSGKITKLSWQFSNDSAEIDYTIKQTYNTNLEEITIEPDNIDI